MRPKEPASHNRLARLSPTRLGRSLERFRRDAGGNVAMMFALTLMPLLFGVGAAIDYATALRARTNLQIAVDSAALAISQRGLTQTNEQIVSRAAAHFDAVKADPNAAVVLAEKRTFDNGKPKVCIVARVVTPTAFMKLAGYDQLTSHAETCATIGSAEFEISLVLDVSGSMNAATSGVVKIDALRTAAKGFVDYLFGASMTNSQVKIAVVPFSTSVAVDPVAYRNANWVDRNGQSSLHWMGFSGQGGGVNSRFDLFDSLRAVRPDWDWKGCFESLPFPLSIQDGAPSGGDHDAKYVPLLNPDEPDSALAGGFLNSYIIDDAGECATPAGSEAIAQSRVCKYRTPTPTNFVGPWRPASPQDSCSSRPLARLDGTAANIRAYIDSLQAEGDTNIHEGMMWGWRAISPASVFADGRPYGPQSARKTIVLMTDGVNAWTPLNNMLDRSYYSAHGYWTTANGSGVNPRLPTTSMGGASLPPPTSRESARAIMDDLTLRACQNIRGAGVTIYTVAFSTPEQPIDAAGKQLLKDCAGDPQRYYDAADAASLNAVFGQIAAAIGRLRLLQ